MWNVPRWRMGGVRCPSHLPVWNVPRWRNPRARAKLGLANGRGAVPLPSAGLNDAVPLALAGVERSALANGRGAVPLPSASLAADTASSESSHRLAGVERSALAKLTGTGPLSSAKPPTNSVRSHSLAGVEHSENWCASRMSHMTVDATYICCVHAHEWHPHLVVHSCFPCS